MFFQNLILVFKCQEPYALQFLNNNKISKAEMYTNIKTINKYPYDKTKEEAKQELIQKTVLLNNMSMFCGVFFNLGAAPYNKFLFSIQITRENWFYNVVFTVTKWKQKISVTKIKVFT